MLLILSNYVYSTFFIKIKIISISYVSIFNNITFELGEIKFQCLKNCSKQLSSQLLELSIYNAQSLYIHHWTGSFIR